MAKLAVTCVQAAMGGAALPPAATEAIDQLDSPDAGLLQPLAAYLRRLAATEPAELAQLLAHPPDNLPEPLPDIFTQLHQAVREAG